MQSMHKFLAGRIWPFILLCMILSAPGPARGEDANVPDAAKAPPSSVEPVSNDYLAVYQEGVRQHDAGDFPAALNSLLLAVKLTPAPADALFLLGVMYEKGEGFPADEVKAAKYFRAAWGYGHKDAYAHLSLMYAGALAGEKEPSGAKTVIPALIQELKPLDKPSDKPLDAKLQDPKLQDPKPQDAKPQDAKPQDAKPQDLKPRDAVVEQVVITIPLEAISAMKDVHFGSSQDDTYRIVLSCPDNCTDLKEKAGKIAALLGGTVSADQSASRSLEPEHFEYISFQGAAPNRSALGISSEVAGALDLTVTCTGWCGIIKVVAHAISEICGQIKQENTASWVKEPVAADGPR